MARPPFTIVDVHDPAAKKPVARPVHTHSTRPVPPAPILPVDPALAEEALERIRKQVQGNGLKPSSVVLRGLYGQVHVFYGTTSIKLQADVQQSKRAGRMSDGQIIAPENLDDAIADFTTRLSTDRGVSTLISETILTRPDQGFGLHGEHLKLPQVTRNFIAHEACKKCHGLGGTPCHNCESSGRIACYRCHGSGGIPCVTCQGKGQILTPQGSVMCHACAGRGLSPCPVCQGQRHIVCPECRGHGKKLCHTCAGLGWSTHTWATSLGAATSFHINTQHLPPPLIGLIERVGPTKLSADGHAQIVPVLGREANDYAAEAIIDPANTLWFLYRAFMPFAELDIAIGRGTIKPKLAGFKARLTDVPNFMDALLEPGVKTLEAAARGGAGGAAKMLEAARYRAIGDTLRALLRMPTRRVHKMLLENYSLGLSDAFTRKLLKNANIALARLSLWPRMMTMVISMVTSFCFFAAFYIYGLRHQLMNLLPDIIASSQLTWLIDIGLAGALGAGGIYAIRLAALRGARTVLEGLGIVTNAQMPLPRPGAPGLWLGVGIIIMLAGFASISGLLAIM